MAIATWILVGAIPVSAGVAMTLAPQGTPAASVREWACGLDARTVQIATRLGGCQGGRFSLGATAVAQVATTAGTAAAPQPSPDTPASADLRDGPESDVGPVREKQPWDDPRWADKVAERLLPKLLELSSEGADATGASALSPEALALPAADEPISAAAENPAVIDPMLGLAPTEPLASGEEMTRAVASAPELSTEPEGDGDTGSNQVFDRDVPTLSITRDPDRHAAEASAPLGRKAAHSKRARNDQVKTRVAAKASHGARAQRQGSPDLSTPIIMMVRRILGPPRQAGPSPSWVVSR